MSGKNQLLILLALESLFLGILGMELPIKNEGENTNLSSYEKISIFYLNLKIISRSLPRDIIIDILLPLALYRSYFTKTTNEKKPQYLALSVKEKYVLLQTISKKLIAFPVHEWIEKNLDSFVERAKDINEYQIDKQISERITTILGWETNPYNHKFDLKNIFDEKAKIPSQAALNDFIDYVRTEHEHENMYIVKYGYNRLDYIRLICLFFVRQIKELIAIQNNQPLISTKLSTENLKWISFYLVARINDMHHDWIRPHIFPFDTVMRLEQFYFALLAKHIPLTVRIAGVTLQDPHNTKPLAQRLYERLNSHIQRETYPEALAILKARFEQEKEEAVLNARTKNIFSKTLNMFFHKNSHKKITLTI